MRDWIDFPLPRTDWHLRATAWLNELVRRVEGTMSYASGWENLGGSYQNVSIRKDHQGVVHLTGALNRPAGTVAAAVNVATLPEGFRPPARIFRICATNAGAARVDIYANGTIEVNNTYGGGNFSFVDINFSFDTA